MTVNQNDIRLRQQTAQMSGCSQPTPAAADDNDPYYRSRCWPTQGSKTRGEQKMTTPQAKGHWYRSASIGSSCAALRAGYQPKKIPTPAATANAS
ncbi:MAG: hypothetical protein L6Q40_06855, partial [Azonexus sp.]|nr:hypothetical protein [Azonexus sp.]